MIDCFCAQLAERKNARELTWLHLIEGVTWIVSTHGGPTLRAVRRREWQEVLIEPMDEETRREVVSRMCADDDVNVAPLLHHA